MSNYVWGPSTSYPGYLQTKSFVRDLVEGQQEIRYEVSKQTREIIASTEQLNRNGIQLLDQVRGLRSDTVEALGRVASQQNEISTGIAELSSSFHWGFNQLLLQAGRLNDSLEQLVAIAKNQAQTWAYEQYEIARDAIRRHLYPEALEAVNHAIEGFGTHTGYKLEYRFHFLKGIILQGNIYNCDADLIDPKTAESAFLTAARYASADHPREASRALLAAGWAGYCQNKMVEAEGYTRQALALDSGLGEGWFQLAKIRMHVGRVDDALDSFGEAIDLDFEFALKAADDGDFQAHEVQLRSFLENRRAEARSVAERELAQADAEIKMMREWHSDERAKEQFAEAMGSWTEAKSRFASGTLRGFAETLPYAIKAYAAAKRANEIQIPGIRNSAQELFRQAEALGNRLDIREHAPVALSEAQRKLAQARREELSRGETYERCHDDERRAHEVLDAFRRAESLATQRQWEIRTIAKHNAEEVPMKKWHGFAVFCLTGILIPDAWLSHFPPLILIPVFAGFLSVPLIAGIRQMCRRKRMPPKS